MTSALSDLQILIHQLGPAMPEIAAVIQEDIENWEIRFDDGAALNIAYQHNPAQAIFTSLLGPANESRQHELYAAMLCANLLYQGVAPIKFALNRPGGDLMLIGEYSLSGLTLETLQSSLSSFRAYADHFCDELGSEENVMRDPVTEAPTPMLHIHDAV